MKLLSVYAFTQHTNIGNRKHMSATEVKALLVFLNPLYGILRVYNKVQEHCI